MSGGAYDYKYHEINEFIDQLQHYIAHEEEPELLKLRKWFQSHLLLVSDAMKELEWYDSGDSSELQKLKMLQEKFGK